MENPGTEKFYLPRSFAAKIGVTVGVAAIALAFAIETRLITTNFAVTSEQLMAGGVSGLVCVGVSLIFL